MPFVHPLSLDSRSVIAALGIALARQRGTGSGLLTVGASMQVLEGTQSVTLWDEIAPPAPLPIPADSSHVAQSNAASDFRQ